MSRSTLYIRRELCLFPNRKQCPTTTTTSTTTPPLSLPAPLRPAIVMAQCIYQRTAAVAGVGELSLSKALPHVCVPVCVLVLCARLSRMCRLASTLSKCPCVKPSIKRRVAPCKPTHSTTAFELLFHYETALCIGSRLATTPLFDSRLTCC